MGVTETGIRNRTNGQAHRYKCVAFIFGQTTEHTVEIVPTGLYVAYLHVA